MKRDQFQQQKKFFSNILKKTSKDTAFLREAGFDCETNEKVTAKFNAFIADKTATKKSRKDEGNALQESELTTSDGSKLTIKRNFSSDRSSSSSSALGAGALGAVKLCTYNGKNAVIKICDDSDHDPLHQFIAYCYTTKQPELLQNYDTFVREVTQSNRLRTAQKGGKTDLRDGRKRTGYECTYENKYFKRYVVLPDLGKSLGSLLYQGSHLGVDNKIKIFLNTVARVKSLHKEDIIHGDIKPDNILITPDKENNFNIIDPMQVQLGDYDSIRMNGKHENITTHLYTAPSCKIKKLKEGDIVALFRTFSTPVDSKGRIKTGYKDDTINLENHYSLSLFPNFLNKTKVLPCFITGIETIIEQGASPYSFSNDETPSNLLDQLVKLLLEYLKENKNLEGVDLESLGYRKKGKRRKKQKHSKNNTSNSQRVISTQPPNTTPTPESTSTHGHKSTSTQDHNKNNNCCQRIHDFFTMFFNTTETGKIGVGTTNYTHYCKKLN